MQNVITVENWVNKYQTSTDPEVLNSQEPADDGGLESNATEEDRQKRPKVAYPRLEEMQKQMCREQNTHSIMAPLINPVTNKPEWPIESPRPIKNYRALSADRSSYIGRGSVEFIPFYPERSDELTCGYLIRAGDPQTGKVLCVEGVPYIRLSNH